jgi:hypothetical protein
MISVRSERILALDIRAKRFSYAVFETPGTVLDWGTRAYTHGTFENRLEILCTAYAPSLILVRNVAELMPRRRLGRAVSVALERFSKRLQVPVRVIEDSTRRQFFAENMRINKYEIALRVATTFPELSWRLPPRRKTWQTEPIRQSVFDAASLGVIFFEQQKHETTSKAE